MRQLLRALTLLALLALAACGSPAATGRAFDPATPTPTPATSAPSSPGVAQGSTMALPITPTATTPPTNTPVPSAAAKASPASRQCAYMMTGTLGNQELTAKLQAALAAAGFSNATARVSDAGENYSCNDGTSGFGLMNRDLSITLPVADLADRQALGTQLAQVVTLASPYATAPSSNRYLVTFTAGGSQMQLTATKGAWEQARQQGLTGAALLDALQHPQ